MEIWLAKRYLRLQRSAIRGKRPGIWDQRPCRRYPQKALELGGDRRCHEQPSIAAAVDGSCSAYRILSLYRFMQPSAIARGLLLWGYSPRSFQAHRKIPGEHIKGWAEIHEKEEKQKFLLNLERRYGSGQ